MELTTLYQQLKDFQTGDGAREFYLLTRARDKDIWSLIGPVSLDNDPPGFKAPDMTLEQVMATLTGIDGTPVASRSGRDLFVLARDKDIWSLTGPLPVESLEVSFGGFFPGGSADEVTSPEASSGVN